MALNLNQLQVFYLVAKLNSVTLAAEKLNVTPPAITMQVKRLEKDVNVRLMFRKGNAIQLTEAGKAIYEKTREIFNKIEVLEEYIDCIKQGGERELSIGCHQTTAKYIMPDLIRKFNTHYPNINIRLITGASHTLTENVINHSIELALMTRRKGNEKMEFRTVGSTQIVLLAAPSSALIDQSAISLSQLAPLPLILREKNTSLREILDAFFEQHALNVNVVMELGSHHLIKEFIQKDVGLGFMERFAVREELEKGLLKEIDVIEGSPRVEYAFFCLNQDGLSPAAVAFSSLWDEGDSSLNE